MINKFLKSVARLFKILAPPKIQFSEKKESKKILLARSIFLMKKSKEQVSNLEWPYVFFKIMNDTRN